MLCYFVLLRCCSNMNVKLSKHVNEGNFVQYFNINIQSINGSDPVWIRRAGKIRQIEQNHRFVVFVEIYNYMEMYKLNRAEQRVRFSYIVCFILGNLYNVEVNNFGSSTV